MNEQALDNPDKNAANNKGDLAFSYENIFKLAENFGAFTGVAFLTAIAFLIPFINDILSLTFNILLPCIGIYAILSSIRILRTIVELMLRMHQAERLSGEKRFKKNPPLHTHFWRLLFIEKLGSTSVASIGIAMMTVGVVPAYLNWMQIYMFSFLHGLSGIVIIQQLNAGALLVIVSICVEALITFQLNMYLDTSVVSSEKSKKLAKISFVIDLCISGLAVSIIFPLMNGDYITVVILLIIACFTSMFPSSMMGTSFKIYYYKIMSEEATRLFKDTERILEIKDLKTWFPIRGGTLSTNIGYIKAVDGVSLSIYRGETLGLVGESGCGKTTLGRTILGLVNRKDGSIVFNGEAIPRKFPPYLRRRIQFIFQDPDASLNPRMNIFQILSEPLRNLNPEMGREDIRNRVLKLMDLVSMNYEHLFRFPHEFSGGQKQRIVIARALACNPEFIVLDEPTSALDVSVQAQILNLLIELQKKLHLSYLFITHNLSVVQHIASRVVVMYLGKVVEIGDVKEIFEKPRHPYTRALLSARSIPDPQRARHRIILKGEVPSPVNPPAGCPFNPRCFYEFKTARCKVEPPKMVEVSPGHYIWTSMEDENACWRMHESPIIEKEENLEE